MIVSLGYVAQGGPQPAECLELVLAARARTVMGNSDAFLLDPAASTEAVTERHLVQREWTLSQLTPEHLDSIRSFEPTVALDLDGLRVLCFHGTPGDHDGVVLPEDPPDGFAGTDADILAGGHVHVPQLRRVGDALYVNPGSVGLGYDHRQPEDDFRFDPWASYAILEGHSVEFHLVPFDAAEVVAATRSSGLPRAEDGLWRWQRRHTSSR